LRWGDGHANGPHADGHDAAANDINTDARTNAGANPCTCPATTVSDQPDRIVDGAVQGPPWRFRRIHAPQPDWLVDFRQLPVGREQ
jgi:hypothetical protein